ncbi:hypothetical protein [Wolbachia endosymbiont (group E) of Neria commutata]|uniref:hypothetical protein n=1 Tax=Wolbachia endosymbiont (group E) of Neria commutata TaxID=3066149 RepID=UPI0031330E19
MPIPQGQSSKETEEKVVETRGPGVQTLKNNLEQAIAGESAGGQTASSEGKPKLFPRTKVSDRADAELEGVGQEEDLDDSNPFKGEIDSPQSPIQAASDASKVSYSLPLEVENSSDRKKLVNPREHIYSTVRSGNSVDKHEGVGGQGDKGNSFIFSNDGSFNGEPGDGSQSVFTDDSQEPLLQGRNDSYVDGNDRKKTSRTGLRVKRAVQRASFVIPMVSATVIAMYTIAYATSVYLQDKGSLIAFIINNPKFITVPGIIALSLFAIGIFCAIKQFNNTIEHQIDEKDPDKIFKKALEPETKEQILRHLAVVHSNGTILHYRFNTWEANKNGIANVDEEVIRKVGKIESVINDRPLFTALSTGFIVANLALPFWLYAAGGISNITTFYQSILATNTGLLSLVATGMFASSILCLGVHYYNKTNCTNVVYLKDSDTSNEKVNKNLLDDTVEQRISTIKKCHDQSGKVESLHVKHLVADLYDGKTLLVECCR